MIYKPFELWGHWKCPHKSPSTFNTCHTHVIIQICVLINHMYTHTHTPTHAHTHTHTHAHTQTHALAHTHARTHAHARTHTHTHTHKKIHAKVCEHLDFIASMKNKNLLKMFSLSVHPGLDEFVSSWDLDKFISASVSQLTCGEYILILY